MTDFVLAHSPHGGSYTWEPVAVLLRARGHRVDIPEYPAHPTAKFWRAQLDAILRLVQSERSVVVAHSGAGPLLASGRAQLAFRCIYVDAGFRKDAGVHPKLPLIERGTGLVPAWANDADLAALLPDAAIRRRLIESLTPLPREHFAEGIPYLEPSDGSAYVLLSPAYAEVAADARARRWPVVDLGTENHYAMLTVPADLADAIERLAS